jgi:hypothetical protein
MTHAMHDGTVLITAVLLIACLLAWLDDRWTR